ncbi:hypothetical protein [Natrialbaceae archaeon AArc-T1-2]|uniref:hypothetical protein n=1 Tax=Natrialbaceae archaeon AArc-T1-2 TaxID=3053904 RepID=UPI00255B332B|nr:hypothetical protein [Natrialbaceae archaeon AArc-T1-2]WIV67892.1 hypothetical protein QQ977_03945 [Natrialbaceae archaeon AArc-T1-2]
MNRLAVTGIVLVVCLLVVATTGVADSVVDDPNDSSGSLGDCEESLETTSDDTIAVNVSVDADDHLECHVTENESPSEIAVHSGDPDESRSTTVSVDAHTESEHRSVSSVQNVTSNVSVHTHAESAEGDEIDVDVDVGDGDPGSDE